MVSPPGPLTNSQALRLAFPDGNRGHGSGAVEVLVHVIPQGDEPRWIVIGDSRDAAPVFRSWRPFKISTRLRWTAVLAASSLGALSRLPGVISTRASIDTSYWRHSLPGFEDDWVPVLHIGNPSHTRKITLFFVGRGDHRFKLVAKIPIHPASAQAILNEASILDQLAGADYLPVPLFQDLERGIAAQAWLEGKPVSRRLSPAHMELLGRFAVPGAVERISAQRASIARELEQADLPFDREVLSRAQELLDYDQPLPAFIEHRDFAPWNLKSKRDGRTGAIDWEWAILRGLPCQDIFRYFYIQDALFHGRGNVWQTLNGHPLATAHYRRFAIPADALPVLGMYYQLRVLAMDWQSGNTFLAQYAFRQIQLLLNVTRARSVKA